MVGVCQFCLDEFEGELPASHEEACAMNPANQKKKRPTRQNSSIQYSDAGTTISMQGMIPVLQRRVLELRNEMVVHSKRKELLGDVVGAICGVVENMGIEDLYSLSFDELKKELAVHDVSEADIDGDHEFIRSFTLSVMKGYTKAVLMKSREKKKAAMRAPEPEPQAKKKSGRFTSVRKRLTKKAPSKSTPTMPSLSPGASSGQPSPKGNPRSPRRQISGLLKRSGSNASTKRRKSKSPKRSPTDEANVAARGRVDSCDTMLAQVPEQPLDPKAALIHKIAGPLVDAAEAERLDTSALLTSLEASLAALIRNRRTRNKKTTRAKKQEDKTSQFRERLEALRKKRHADAHECLRSMTLQHGSDSLSIKENDTVEGYYLAHVGIRNAEQISVKEEEFDVWRGPNKKWKALRYVAMREQHLGVMVTRAQEIQETFPDYCLYLYEMSDNSLAVVVPLKDTKVFQEGQNGWVLRLENGAELCIAAPPEHHARWEQMLTHATQESVVMKTTKSSMRLTQRITSTMKKVSKGTSLTHCEDADTQTRSLAYFMVFRRVHMNPTLVDALGVSDHFVSDATDAGVKLVGGTIGDIVKYCFTLCDTLNHNTLGLFFGHTKLLGLTELIDLFKSEYETWEKKQFDGIGEHRANKRLLNLSRTVMLTTADLDPEHFLDIAREFVAYASEKFGESKLQTDLQDLYECVLQFDKARSACRARVEGLEVKSLWAGQGVRKIESVLEIPPSVMAEQLTLVEADYHNSIRINELVELRWQKNGELAPNVMRASSRFNRFSRIVSTQILTADSPKQRAKVIGHFLAVAVILLKMRNYSSCVQIMCGINCIPVQRLKKFPEHLSYKSLVSLEELTARFDPCGSYKPYRELPHDYPTIPFHDAAVAMRDLTFALEGNPSKLENDEEAINFERMRMAGEILTNIWVRLPLEYPGLARDEAVCEYLHCLPALTQDDMYEKSNEIQPPRNQKARVASADDDEPAEEVHGNPLYGMHPGIVQLLISKCQKESFLQHNEKTFMVSIQRDSEADDFDTTDASTTTAATDVDTATDIEADDVDEAPSPVKVPRSSEEDVDEEARMETATPSNRLSVNGIDVPGAEGLLKADWTQTM